MNWEQMSQPAKKSKAEGYQGFKLSKSSKNEIETINLDEPIVTKEWFFQNYIKPRKPVLIKYNANSEKFRLKTENFRPDTLIKTLGDEGDLLQVEELSKGGFGSGLRQDIFPQIVFWRVGKEGAITVSVLELHQLPSIMVATHLC